MIKTEISFDLRPINKSQHFVTRFIAFALLFWVFVIDHEIQTEIIFGFEEVAVARIDLIRNKEKKTKQKETNSI